MTRPDATPVSAGSALAAAPKGQGTLLRIHVQPRASRTEVVGYHGDAVKVRVAGPPVDGKANEECRRFLAKALGVPASAVEIVRGDTGRNKAVLVRGLTPEAVAQKLGLG
jgi:uncharacterized protein (TIGR00251 family)